MKYLKKFILTTALCFASMLVYAAKPQCRLTEQGAYDFKHFIAFDYPAGQAWKDLPTRIYSTQDVLFQMRPQNEKAKNPSQSITVIMQVKKGVLDRVYQYDTATFKHFCKNVQAQKVSQDKDSITYIIQYSDCRTGQMVNPSYSVSKVFIADGTYVINYVANLDKTTAAQRKSGLDMIKKARIYPGCALIY